MACWVFDNFGEERSVLSSSSEKNLLVHGESWWSFCFPGCITTRIPCRELIKFTNRTVDWAGPPQADELIHIPIFWERINRIKSSRFTTIWETLIEINSPNLKNLPKQKHWMEKGRARWETLTRFLNRKLQSLAHQNQGDVLLGEKGWARVFQSNLWWWPITPQTTK